MEKIKLKGRKSKTQKVITLVVLIITIIVILILSILAIRRVSNNERIQYEKDAESAITVEQSNNGENNPSGKVDEDLEKYILGQDGEGRNLFGILNPSSMLFIQDQEDSTSTMHEKVKLAYMPDGTDVYIRYNRNVYKFSVMEDENKVSKTVKGSLALVNAPAGNLGKYVTYKGITWIVLRDNTDRVDLISANALGSVTLGGEKFDSVRTSYNNAIETLVDACITATGITENIRNVGGLPADAENIAKVNFSSLTTFRPAEGVKFDEFENYTNSLNVGDENYLSDKNQLENLGILITDNPTTYWLASRFVYEDSYNVNFRMRCVNRIGEASSSLLCNVDSLGYSYYSTITYAVRPVVSLSSGILNSATQSGTIDNPIILH